MKLKNNLTFAVLMKDGGWKADLTIRFCEYFSHKINEAEFISKIDFPQDVDEAVENCQTDYLLILKEGSLPLSDQLFNILNQCADEREDMFLANIELVDDYMFIHDNFIFVNKSLWLEMGNPPFNSRLKEGPTIKCTKLTNNKYFPMVIELDEKAEHNTYIDSNCSSNGAEWAVRQLKYFKTITCVPAVISYNEWYYLDGSKPFKEIYTETFFEKNQLTKIRSKVFAFESDVMENIKDVTCDIVVAPAQGLKAINLGDYFMAKKIIVFDSNPISLELQKLIFGVTKPTPYKEIVEEFIKLYPNSKIDNWEEDQYRIVSPIKAEVQYKIIDVFSYEIIELILSIPHEISAVFDFSDIFVYPFNFYRRPMYQVKGLFGELFSLIKSRAGHSHIMGFAPGYENLDHIDVNTSIESYNMPDTLPEEETEIINPVKKVEVKPVEVKPVYVAPIKKEAVAPKVVFDFDIAKELGYTKENKFESTDTGFANMAVYSKSEEFPEVNAIFEYVVDPATHKWSFRVSKPESDLKITFIYGEGFESFSKHINTEVKINPVSVAKRFK